MARENLLLIQAECKGPETPAASCRSFHLALWSGLGSCPFPGPGFLSLCGCARLCELGLGFEKSKTQNRSARGTGEAHTGGLPGVLPSCYTLGRGCRGHCASRSRPLRLAHTHVHTHSGALAGLAGRKCQLHVFQALSASRETPLCSDTSSEPCRLSRPGCLGGPPAGACDSGLSQAEAGCQGHSLGHEESLLFIGSATAGPAWQGRGSLCHGRVGGVGVASPGLG